MHTQGLSSRPLRFLPILGFAFAACAGIAQAQSLLTAQGKLVVSNDDLVPSLTGGEIFGAGGTFDTGALTDDGRIFFRGRFAGGAQTSLNERALFLGSDFQNLSLILRGGDPEPSGTIPGATMNTATASGIGSSVRISGNGNFMFFGTSLNDGGVNVTTANDTAYYVGNPGNWSILAREGDPAPGTVGATFSSSFNSPSTQNTGLNNNGVAFFKSNLTGGDVSGTTNNDALFTGTPGNLSLVMRKGDTLPGGEVILAVMPSFISQTNQVNHVLYDVSLVQGTGSPVVDASNDRALMLYVPGFGSLVLVREGDAAPYAGVTYSNASATWSASIASTAFNASSQALLSAALGGTATVGVDDQALLLLQASGVAPIVRKGDPVPGLPGVTFGVFNSSNTGVNDNGQIYFQASLVGGTVTDPDDTAIFVSEGAANIRMIAREGDVAPGSGGGLFPSLNGVSSFMNGKGQVQFSAGLSGGPFDGSAVYVYDRQLGLRPAVFSGETIELQPGNPQVTSGGGGIQFNNGDSRPLTYNSNGTNHLRVSYIGGRASMATIGEGTLAGSPASISVSMGGTQTLYTNLGSFNDGKIYLVVGTLSGTNPGLVLDSLPLPINPDVLTNLTITGANVPPFGNTFGFLNDAGQATSTVTVPAGTFGLSGATANFATLAIDISVLPQVVAITNAASLTFLP